MRTLIFLLLLILVVFTSGCQEETPQPVSIPPQTVLKTNEAQKPALAAVQETTTITETGQGEPEEQPAQSEQETPRPPIAEDFQGTPQLSLFPRVGDYRPEQNSDRLPFWNTFIDHLLRVTGVIEEQTTGNRAWVLRGIDSIESVGYFAPLAVEPQASYQVTFTLTTELQEGASAGVGIIEFNEFLWIPGQYTEEIFKKHFRGTREGTRLTGTNKGERSFTFTTGPESRMIHVVLFREGTHDRNSVIFDDIRIEGVKE
ncbi:MAG: hypothetical protein RQ722_04485 [Desulfuromonadales bacterium]|nr:hypothetical protein [Desulfuromonadales bacterium]